MSDDKTRLLAAEELAAAAGGEGRTRVLSAEEIGRLGALADKAENRAGKPAAGAKATRAPQFMDGKIVFFCSNNHRIVVPREFAGKRGTCSKAGCGVTVVIPRPPAEAAPAWPAVEEPEPASGEAAPPSGAEPPPVPAEVEPAAADAGTPGGSIVGIEADVAEPTGEAAAAEAFGPGGGEEEAATGPDMALEMPVEVPEPWGDELTENTAALLMKRLWLEVQHGGGALELHLTNGSVVRPEAYERNWSRGDYGVFANFVGDDRVTLTAVAWNSVQKIVVLNVKGLADDMFK